MQSRVSLHCWWHFLNAQVRGLLQSLGSEQGTAMSPATVSSPPHAAARAVAKTNQIEKHVRTER
jgi:hypothetical protein